MTELILNINTSNGLALKVDERLRYTYSNEILTYNQDYINISSIIDNKINKLVISERIGLLLRRFGIRLENNFINALLDASKLIARKLLYGAPIVVRMHNDCDGFSGAFAIFKLAEKIFNTDKIRHISFRANSSISYSLESFNYDKSFLQLFRSIEKPLIILIDFGSTKETIDIIRGNTSIDFIIIDHHPYDIDIEGIRIINSYTAINDNSITAGFMTALIAYIIEELDVYDIINSSFISDHSRYALYNDHSEKLAYVIDYMMNNKSIDYSFYKIADTIQSNETTESLYKDIIRKVNEVVTLAEKEGSLIQLRNLSIFILDLNRFDSKHRYDYPKLGKLTSYLSIDLEKKYSSVLTIAYKRKSISIRISESAGRVVDLRYIKDKLKHSDIVSIGGHMQAGSIICRSDEATEEVVDSLVDLISQRDLSISMYNS
ncbi:MAG: hypothetical protein ARM1_0130 [Candidatus Micrarchaeota archaeon]|nr:MAG: hypothetical protein ARM1_0130 [Candidatus Micrarchaeota archaeon]